MLGDEHPIAENDEPRRRRPETRQLVNDKDALHERQVKPALGRRSEARGQGRGKLMRERSVRVRFWDAGE
jgi:hypothetical protein